MSACIQENDLTHAVFVTRHSVSLVVLKDIFVFILDNALFHVINVRKNLVHMVISSHQRVHIGERSYSCDICKKSFSVFDSLTFTARASYCLGQHLNISALP